MYYLLVCLGVYPVWDHVRKWQEGSSHGQEPLLWRREFLYHPFGGGKTTGRHPFKVMSLVKLKLKLKFLVVWSVH